MDLWRIIYKKADAEKWSPMSNKIYFTKGMATGVLKRSWGLEPKDWDDQEKMWVDPRRTLVYRIQGTKVEWTDCDGR